MSADRAMRARSLLLPAVFALAAFAFLMSLGFWQLQRLAWKEGLLAQIAERLNAPPQPLPSSWSSLSQAADEYRHVTVKGVFDHDKEAFVFRTAGSGLGEAGFYVLTPLRLESGGSILVNRGFVPERLRDPAQRVADQVTGNVTLSGVLRWPEDRNMFTPSDDPAQHTWYTRDPPAIAKALGLNDAAVFSLDADPNAQGAVLRGGATTVNIHNDHLSYAFTWFGLAVTLLVIFALVAWRRLRAG
ncbi:MULTISPECIES: SURF1 family protein [unclassified Beijerinckia]|uniref:SURF1 family protein n=1 Tax=unclassified Beijerinckia TaxID=2638183 RepID=UPI000896D3D9|nr:MULTISPECIES: SURF1 family protein [unclassified Beijerinckia]MDH7797780.1 surfeit locus 1 family protein [Beijerinckia sp. GAS462]SEC98347.1 surfeit locus 1 family protein [Beijerinckia sp. 28-YEA-48]